MKFGRGFQKIEESDYKLLARGQGSVLLQDADGEFEVWSVFQAYDSNFVLEIEGVEYGFDYGFETVRGEEKVSANAK